MGLVTGHNTLRRHGHLLGLSNSPLCRRYGVKEETSVHILCECETAASFRNTYLASIFSEPEDIKIISLGAIWNFSKVTGLPYFDMGYKGSVIKGLGASGPVEVPNPLVINRSIDAIYFIICRIL